MVRGIIHAIFKHIMRLISIVSLTYIQLLLYNLVPLYGTTQSIGVMSHEINGP